MTNRKPLTRNSKIILADLFRARRPLSIKKIAERNDIQWKTANKNISLLEKRRLVSCSRTTRRTYCQVNKNIRKMFGH